MEQEIADTGVVTDAAGPVDSITEQSDAHVQETPTEQVPLQALQAERRERQNLQDKVRLLEDHMSLIQANQSQPAKQDDLGGLADDDVLTVGEFKKALQQKEQQYQMGLEELRVSQKYKDYEDVVREYLPKVIEKNPALKATLSNDPNKYELAYYLARNSDEFRSTRKQSKKSEEATRIVENSQRPGSLSAIGTGTGGGQPTAYKHMSDADFMKLANKNRGAF